LIRNGGERIRIFHIQTLPHAKTPERSLFVEPIFQLGLPFIDAGLGIGCGRRANDPLHPGELAGSLKKK